METQIKTKWFFKLFLFSTMAFFINGCAFHSGIVNSSTSLSSNNFTVVKYATGTAQTTHVLGIGGLTKQALVAEAKSVLLANNPLKKGQALANLSVDFKTTFLLLVVVTKVTVTADIVQFE